MIVLFINRLSISKVSKTDVIEFAKYYNELTKPILMICLSGTRSTLLFNEAKNWDCSMNKMILLLLISCVVVGCSSMNVRPTVGVSVGSSI